MTEAEFQPFPKIARLNRLCIATEKIDGTNALVHVDDEGRVRAGSRSRWITPQDDNYGFAKWVEANADELRKLGPGYHYGEWWGSGIQRGYGLKNGEKRFSLFNVSRWSDPAVRPACCHVVPTLVTGTDIREVADESLGMLRSFGSQVVPGYMKPEGIVVYHTHGGHLFKVTIEKDEEPKGKAS